MQSELTLYMIISRDEIITMAGDIRLLGALDPDIGSVARPRTSTLKTKMIPPTRGQNGGQTHGFAMRMPGLEMGVVGRAGR